MVFPVVDVSAWEVLEPEATGRNPHPWLRDSATGEAWLFKPVVVKNGHRQGEDWSEKLASVVGKSLGVPCADIELAQRAKDEGCISRDLKPRHGWQLQTGALLLTDVVPGYVPQDVRRRGHSLDNIQLALAGVSAPPEFIGPHMSAFDVFAGYRFLTRSSRTRTATTRTGPSCGRPELETATGCVVRMTTPAVSASIYEIRSGASGLMMGKSVIGCDAGKPPGLTGPRPATPHPCWRWRGRRCSWRPPSHDSIGCPPSMRSSSMTCTGQPCKSRRCPGLRLPSPWKRSNGTGGEY